MIRYWLFLFSFFIICSSAWAQQIGDTLYFKHADTDTQAVFISAPHSKFHQRVFEHLLSHTDLQNLVKKQNGTHDHNQQWITVRKYKGKFYAYSPSEPYYNTFISIHDSTLILNDFNDGFVEYRIIARRKTSKGLYYSLKDERGKKHFLSIQAFKGNIHVIASSLFNKTGLFFVKRSDYDSFPIIVNECPGHRCPEFEF